MSELYTNQQMEEFKRLINSSNNILIISHTNPDGDAIGAALALYNTLHEKKINSKVMLPNAFPDYYNFLYNSDKIIIAFDRLEESRLIINEADLIIATDFNSFSRIAQLENEFKNSSAKKVLIDHHLSPEIESFDLVFSKIEISSSSEYVYWILKELFGEDFLNKEIAECIYTGICTDTGSFSYSCNYPSTYAVVIHMMQVGIDGEDLHYKIYNTFSESRLRLLGYCLSEKMRVLQDIGVAYISLSQEELKQFNFQIGDTEGIVNYTLMMNSVEVGIFMAEYPDKIRMSFRSKGDFDVNIFARKYFNGGGHKKASGGSSFKNLDDTIVELEKALKESIQK